MPSTVGMCKRSQILEDNMTPIDTVQRIYAAFGRGDVPTILDALAEDVDWEHDSFPNPVPWLQPLTGRAQVPRFFEALNGAVDMKRFEVSELFSQGSTVVALCQVEFVVRATGKAVVEVDEVHLWRLDPQGRVRRFRHRADTWQQAMALKGD